jgi:hypothetical protein
MPYVNTASPANHLVRTQSSEVKKFTFEPYGPPADTSHDVRHLAQKIVNLRKTKSARI